MGHVSNRMCTSIILCNIFIVSHHKIIHYDLFLCTKGQFYCLTHFQLIDLDRFVLQDVYRLKKTGQGLKYRRRIETMDS